MLADMRTLHDRYSDEEMAVFVQMVGEAGDILRRHALAIRAASRR